MTPEQKLKWAIVSSTYAWQEKDAPEFPCDHIDAIYEEIEAADEHWDGKSEVRSGEIDTGLECDWSRHYESKSVAMQFPDGSWVGWTYWYGGGKHGEPEAIDWMCDAYDLECTEEEKVVTVRTFTKPSSQVTA